MVGFIIVRSSLFLFSPKVWQLIYCQMMKHHDSFLNYCQEHDISHYNQCCHCGLASLPSCWPLSWPSGWILVLKGTIDSGIRLFKRLVWIGTSKSIFFITTQKHESDSTRCGIHPAHYPLTQVESLETLIRLLGYSTCHCLLTPQVAHVDAIFFYLIWLLICSFTLPNSRNFIWTKSLFASQITQHT